MNQLRSLGAAALLPLLYILAPTAADAATSLPVGTQVGTATDTLTLAGTYTSGTGAQPFASPNFTFTAVLPQEVSFQSDIGSENFLISTFGASYTDNGQTQTFSASPANGPFGNSNGAALRNGGAEIDFTAINNQGEFVLDAPATMGSYYTLAANGLTATINPGAYTVLSGDATYDQFNDPPFTGTITVTPNAGGGGGGGPEPSTWALMMVGVFGVGAALRRSTAEKPAAAPEHLEGARACVAGRPIMTPDAATFIAALNRLEQSGDAKEIAALFSDDARVSNPLMAEAGREGAARFWTAYRSAFSRIASSFTSILEQDGRICLEWTSSGEIEGQPVAYEGVSLLQVGEDGIVAFRTYFDPTRLGAPRQAQA